MSGLAATIGSAADLNLVLNLGALVAIVAAAWVALRYKGTIEALTASGGAWKDERDAEKAKSERITADNEVLEARIAVLEAKIVVLEAKTDLTAAMKETSVRHEETLRQLRAGFADQHQTAVAIVQSLEAIAKRINGGLAP